MAHTHSCVCRRRFRPPCYALPTHSCAPTAPPAPLPFCPAARSVVAPFTTFNLLDITCRPTLFLPVCTHTAARTLHTPHHGLARGSVGRFVDGRADVQARWDRYDTTHLPPPRAPRAPPTYAQPHTFYAYTLRAAPAYTHTRTLLPHPTHYAPFTPLPLAHTRAVPLARALRGPFYHTHTPRTTPPPHATPHARQHSRHHLCHTPLHTTARCHHHTTPAHAAHTHTPTPPHTHTHHTLRCAAHLAYRGPDRTARDSLPRASTLRAAMPQPAVPNTGTLHTLTSLVAHSCGRLQACRCVTHLTPTNRLPHHYLTHSSTLYYAAFMYTTFLPGFALRLRLFGTADSERHYLHTPAFAFLVYMLSCRTSADTPTT